jgi:hypothetical protein
MVVAPFVLTAVFALAQQQPTTGTLQGTVVRAGTTEAISDARITIEVIAPAPAGIPARDSRATPPPAPVIPTTDAQGHFSAIVPFGLVTVRAEHEGYFGPSRNGGSPAFVSTTATVAADHADVVRLELIPGATINGRVTDQTGKPISETAVIVARRLYRDGVPTIDLTDGKATDDRGAYRIYRIPPGEYFVVAFPKPGAATPSSGPAPAAGTLAPVTTFYPGAIDLDTAQPIVLKGGEELNGVDVQINTSPTFTVSGHVVSTLPPGSEVSAINRSVRSTAARITIVPHSGASLPSMSVGADATAEADGSFQIRGLLPGAYDLIARLPASTGWGTQNGPDHAASPWAFGRLPIDVGGNLDNLTITVHQGVDIPGKVTVDGKGTPAQVKVSLAPDDESASFINFFDVINSFGVFLGADGGFVFPVMPEGRYRVRVGLGAGPTRAPTPNAQGQLPPKPLPLGANAYVADVLQGGRSVYDAGLVVGTEAAAPLEVRIQSDGGAVEGTVQVDDHSPWPGATVVLVPEARHRQNALAYKTAPSDEAGRFTITHVPPGSYTAYAWDSVLPAAYMNADFMERYAKRGVAVKVDPGGTAKTELTVIK